MLPSTLKYLYSVEPFRMHVQMLLCAMLHSSIAHSIICTLLFRGKMCSDWFNEIEILQGRWQRGGKVGYRYLRRLEKTLCEWDIHVLLVTKGLTLRLLMSYIYGAPILDVSRSHTTTQHSR